MPSNMSISNELIIHLGYNCTRRDLHAFVTSEYRKNCGDDWHRSIYENVSGESQKKLNSVPIDENYIRTIDDLDSYKLLNKISWHLWKKNKVKVKKMRESRIRDEDEYTKAEKDRARYDVLKDISNVLKNSRRFYAHPGEEDCPYETAQDVFSNLINMCDYMEVDNEVYDTVLHLRDCLADPTRNESYSRISIGGQDLSQPTTEQVDDIDEATVVMDDIVIEKNVNPGTIGISLDMFLEILAQDGVDHRADQQQLSIISSPVDRSIRIIAGPGSGKTSVIAAHILKAVFVDGVQPSAIMATTFTKKAARELRDRILSRGERLRDIILHDPDVLLTDKDRIRYLNLGDITLGTLDSIARDQCDRHRMPDTIRCSMTEEFVPQRIMSSIILADEDNLKDGVTDEWDGKLGLRHNDEKTDIDVLADYCLMMHSRITENCMDLDSLEESIPHTVRAIRTYRGMMAERHLCDFPQLESQFLSFLESDQSEVFSRNLRMLLVDEYQDTNPIQERIYLSLGRSVVENGGSVKVVGDDDQSLYRFRGSRVDLFTNLPERAVPYGITFHTESLSTNYRSTPDIVGFCNTFANLDPVYRGSRAGKPDMTAIKEERIPVLGLFRDRVEGIGTEIVRIVDTYFDEGIIRYTDRDGSRQELSFPGERSGNDLVMLGYSTKTHKVIRSGRIDRLPGIMDRKMSRGNMKVCNPHGTDIHDQGPIMELCGLLMTCIDPDHGGYESVKKNMRRSNYDMSLTKTLLIWRRSAENILKDRAESPLADYVEAWRTGRISPGKDRDSIPVIRIVYDLMFLLGRDPGSGHDLEHEETVLRTLENAAQMDPRCSRLPIVDGRVPSDNIISFYEKAMLPLANDLIDLDPDLVYGSSMEDRFNIMSIHQSKGLEFPIVFVDVSSAFNHRDYDKDQRFPEYPDQVHKVDSFLMGHSNDGVMRTPSIDDQFDDIVRRCYVAFSRAQKVLILVGLRDDAHNIPNVAVGFTRDGEYHGDEFDVRMI